MLLASAPFQYDFLEAVREDDRISWRRIICFHILCNVLLMIELLADGSKDVMAGAPANAYAYALADAATGVPAHAHKVFGSVETVTELLLLGCAKVDITPEKPLVLAGFACRKGVYERIAVPLHISGRKELPACVVKAARVRRWSFRRKCSIADAAWSIA